MDFTPTQSLPAGSEAGMDANANTGVEPSSLEHIAHALQATLNPRVPNIVRQQALQHLEAVKSQPDAPAAGFALAADASQPAPLRYYGLQLLEFAIRFRWAEYTAAQTLQLREWVCTLAAGLADGDEGFVRKKIAQLWVMVAKRCWGGEGGGEEDEEIGEQQQQPIREDSGEQGYNQGNSVHNQHQNGDYAQQQQQPDENAWWDMDAQLLALWEKPFEEKGTTNKLLVLYILETLSEEIINGEDVMSGLRMEVLGHALNEVMVPARLYRDHETTRGRRQCVRAGDDGWLRRMCDLFVLCVKQAQQGSPLDARLRMVECATKTLHALRPTMSWISLKAADEADAISCLFLSFQIPYRSLQTAAIEVLYALLSRQYNAHWKDTWMRLFMQALRSDHVTLVRNAFESTHAGPGEDDESYTLQKKMSELLSVLGDAVAQHQELLDDSIDLAALFDLLLLVMQSNSLTVSIPVLHSWTKQMGVPAQRTVDLVLNALGTLLQTCSERLLQYESLPEDTDDEVVQFLNEDFDTLPEKHAFLGNYRRYCKDIIQSITRSRPTEALSHVMGQMLTLLQDGPYTEARGFSSATYSKSSLSQLRFNAQSTVVSSALKGYAAWMNDVSELPVEDPLHMKAQKDQQAASESLQQWCYNIMTIHTDDPTVLDQVLQTLVSVLRTLRTPPAEFVLRIVQHMLTIHINDNPAHPAFSDAVKGCEYLRMLELQKLAATFPNYLLEVYQELEPRIEQLCQSAADDPRLFWGYRAFLFLIIHRASRIEPEMRFNRLQHMLKPTYEAWIDPSLGASINSLQDFCQLLGLENMPDFYTAHRFDQIQDWSEQQLDANGQARQNEIRERGDRLPLRMTKSMLDATTAKLKSGTDEYETACALWANLIPAILPNLLQMLRHAQAFHNINNWSQLPGALQAVVRRTLQDRFWQSGISNESKDEFYARISGSKTSYEGFASTVRGSIRSVREQSCHILWLLTKFEEQFYSLTDLAEPLADALFADAGSLGANHLHPLINLVTGLVQRCPPHYRAQFLPPIIRRLFISLDAKISAEWDSLSQAAEENKREDDELGDEMRTESVLRQLTFSMVSFVPFILEFDNHGAAAYSAHSQANGHTPARPALSELVLSDPSILEPLVLFCTHALRMRDTRCCTIICRTVRTIIPLFASPSQSPSSAPSQPPGPHHAASSAGALSITEEAAAQVREFVSTEVLKACITSLHEPYFADMQKDLAALVAQILLLYAPRTRTPRDVLLSLPDMPAARVDKALARICRGPSERQQRSLVLDLLADVRGVSIYEAGKFGPASGGGGGGTSVRRAGKDNGVDGAAGGDARQAGHHGGRAAQKKSRVPAQYMEVEQRPAIVDGDEVGLDGVAGLFGEGS